MAYSEKLSDIIVLEKCEFYSTKTNIAFRVGVIKIVIVINCNLITFSKEIACNCN